MAVSKSVNFPDLSIDASALYLLARPSTADDIREDVLARVEAQRGPLSRIAPGPGCWDRPALEKATSGAVLGPARGAGEGTRLGALHALSADGLEAERNPLPDP